MNKYKKAIIAIAGAINHVFNFFTPIALCAVIIQLVDLMTFQKVLLLTIGFISSLYRAYRVGFKE